MPVLPSRSSGTDSLRSRVTALAAETCLAYLINSEEFAEFATLADIEDQDHQTLIVMGKL